MLADWRSIMIYLFGFDAVIAVEVAGNHDRFKNVAIY
jgi:hypothetical protein